MDELKSAISKLRHAYMQLAANSVIDQRGLAEGLIAPQIEYLETIVADMERQQAAYDKVMDHVLNPRPPTQALIDLMRNYRDGVASGRITKPGAAPAVPE
jgi:hypothetical protein